MKIAGAEQIELIERNGIEVERNLSGKKLSTFLSGGNINYTVYPKSESELKIALDILSGYCYHFLGLGSNSLIADEGVNIIVTTRRMTGYEFEGNYLRVKAGESVHKLSGIATEKGLSGMEFMFGIPGSVGGAVKMNAGAFGSEMKDILRSVTLYKNGETFVKTANELSFGYRQSDLEDAVAIECLIELKEDDATLCRKRCENYMAYRKATQPNKPSLGSVFKKVNGTASAKYIENLHMKGTRFGDAVLSEKHCNFIVNERNATSKDYLKLMQEIKERALRELGVELEEEIKIIKD